MIKSRNDELLKALALKIKSLRESKGLSQYALSVKAEISKNQVGQIERLEQIPNICTLERIALALGVTLSEMVDVKY